MSENVIQDKLILDISNFLDSIKKAEEEADGLGDSVEEIEENLKGVKEQIKTIDDFKAKLKSAIADSNTEIERLKRNLKGAQADFAVNQSDANFEAMQEAWKALEKEQEHKEELLNADKQLNEQRRALVEKQKELNEALKEAVELKKQEEQISGFTEGIETALRGLKQFIKGVIGIQTIATLAKKLAGENEKLANSLKIMWNVLGQAWAPLFNWISGIIKQIVVYWASIYKYIFGVNILDKALKNGAKNAKSIKNSLAGFDEITNLDKGSGADTGWLADLKSLKLDMGWVEAFNDLTGIPDLLKDVVKWLKDPSWENFDKILSDTNGLITTFGLILVAIGNPFFAVIGWVMLLINWFDNLGVHVDKFTGTLAVDTSGWSDRLKEFGKTFEKWKQGILDGIVSVAQYVWSKVQYIWSKISWLFESSTTKANETSGGFKKVMNGLIGFFQGLINVGIMGLNWLIRQINKIHFSIPDWVPLVGGKSVGFNLKEVGYADLPRLATGTNFVASEGLAYLHQGEAVIPKKFNKEEYFGSGNEETNMLLTNILNIVSNMDMNPQVAVSDIVKGISKQSRVKGVSVI